MPAAQPPRTFGRRKEPHTIIIARGDRVRHFTLRPVVAALLLGAGSLLSVATMGAAAYLFLEDDIAAVALSRQDSLRDAYEERIASLRAQLDQATTRQIVDRDLVETKVDALLDQHEELADRFERLRPMFEKAQVNGLLSDPQADADGNDAADAEPSLGASMQWARLAGALAYGDESATAAIADRFALIDRGAGRAADEAIPGFGRADLRRAAPDGPQTLPRLVDAIEAAVEIAEIEQIERAASLAEDARERSTRILDSLRVAGIDMLELEPASAQGGPYQPVATGFDAAIADLDAALSVLQRVHEEAANLPLSAPVKGGARSSGFGVRRDPFLGRSALHSGVDFAAPTGTVILAPASGTVTQAGTQGGYGRMVEIDHGNGIVTRFAHMSRISVSLGAAIAAGETIGHVGSTGRSTGPHLHYEIRRDGVALDPDRFLKAGRAIASLS